MGRGSSAHTNLDHLLSSLIAPCTLDHLRTQGFCHLAHLYTHTLLPQGGGVGGGIKHTRSSAPAQHCGGGGGGGGEGGMVSTPAQVHPLSAVSTHAEE